MTASVSLVRYLKLGGEVFPFLTQEPIWKSSEEKHTHTIGDNAQLKLAVISDIAGKQGVEDEIAFMCTARN